ncbi:NAD-dependent epimerase/dehydratase family protein [Brachybacterium sp. p3-SID957]|uniref:polysaccharide biosynthesis C-terminal domain-containing protein n=1 Tax=Brachybacterium sp. p3-SID957 TaxID=2916049 RepID=UPI00223A72FE|nr:NAD-dependent epimerase/dehydratase family protein [Brachybacterium sp. p3-SID957]MCT1777143.1 capsule biosynthesis protein CapF [Brachybacterium sp. p3-SID957]
MPLDTDARILITGAYGFLGWHLRIRLQSLGYENVQAVGREQWDSLRDFTTDIDVVFHLAGINRAEDDVVENGNRELAEQLRDAFGDGVPQVVVFADTIHADSDTPYGRGKTAAAQVLRGWMNGAAGRFVDVRLPNLFGEHGRPFYNSFVPTFVELAVIGKEPDIQDREVPLLHVQAAAQTIIDAVDAPAGHVTPEGTAVRVSEVWEILREQHSLYEQGTIPDISEPLRRDLFNMLRSRMFLDRPAIPLKMNTDYRGSFVETARVMGGQGQTSFSTTGPGITRGQHYHLRKAERFVVLSGSARISIAKVFGDPTERVDLDVDGDSPTAVDMPTGWAHNITNTGEQTLITQFWISELFDSTDPDTVPSEVPER